MNLLCRSWQGTLHCRVSYSGWKSTGYSLSTAIPFVSNARREPSSNLLVLLDKLSRHLPGFSCDWDVAKGARQFHELFKQIDFTREDFEFRPFTRLKQLQYLIRTDQIDQDFFWKTDF